MPRFPMGRAHRAPWLVAVAADVVQWWLLPAFAPGGFSPFEAGLDFVVSAFLVWRLGWHWAFLPAAIAELTPGVDLVPTWTMAVWIATRGKGDRPGASSGPAPPAPPPPSLPPS
ncbi:MAG: hypothetical protein U0704_14380 [Candidatus Eisenbacteria bacterium]